MQGYLYRFVGVKSGRPRPLCDPISEDVAELELRAPKKFSIYCLTRIGIRVFYTNMFAQSGNNTEKASVFNASRSISLASLLLPLLT